MSGAWPALKEGDLVQVIAPSGPFDAAGLERGVALLRSRYQVELRQDVHARAGFLAGDDRRRTDELLAALQDERVRGVVAARGGYGATRLLAHVSEPAIAALSNTPKLLVGFSDITALHALWRRAGVGSLHAAMAARVGLLPEPTQARWLDALAGRFTHTSADLSPIATTATPARGRLTGGNLSVLYALLGTPHMPSLAGTVLFLEDVNERPYAVDRMLTSLRDSGHLGSVAGIVLGAFNHSQPGADGVTVEAVLSERLSDLNVPVLGGLPAGHVDDNLELPFGAEVELDSQARVLRVLEAAQGDVS